MPKQRQPAKAVGSNPPKPPKLRPPTDAEKLKNIIAAEKSLEKAEKDLAVAKENTKTMKARVEVAQERVRDLIGEAEGLPLVKASNATKAPPKKKAPTKPKKNLAGGLTSKK